MMLSIRRISMIAVLATGLVAPALAQEAAEEAPAATEAAPKPKPKPRKVAPPPKPGAPAPVAPPAAAKAVWPEGAGTVSETYGDWTINCARAEDRTSCSLLQSQGSKRDNRREFAVELRTPLNDRTDGLILMPFGFDIETGVTFKLDEAVMGKGAPFYTCTLDGCLVPVSLPTLATDTMRTAQKLLVIAQKPETKEPTTITVSLTGFGAALARASALAN